MHYLRARYLNTSTGRFFSADTFAGDPQSPSSLHKYLYASANPVDRIDPNGQQDTLLVALSTSVAISDILENVAINNFAPAWYFFVGIKDFWQPGFAMRNFALAVLSSGRLDSEEVSRPNKYMGLDHSLSLKGQSG